MKRILAFFMFWVMSASVVYAAPTVAQKFNDYPTQARADYVFTCMAVNGNSSNELRKCSCAIDVIASIMPYKKYVEAETVLSMQQVSGERATLFKSAQNLKNLVADLRRAQVEADFTCFH